MLPPVRCCYWWRVPASGGRVKDCCHTPFAGCSEERRGQEVDCMGEALRWHWSPRRNLPDWCLRDVSGLGGDRGGFSSQTSCGFWGWFFWLKDHGSTTCCTGEGILQSHWGIDPGPAPARNCTVQMSSNASWHHPHGNSCYQWHCQSAAAWGYVDPSLCLLRALFLTLQASPITVQQLSQLAPPSSWRSAYFWTSQGQEILPHPNMSLLLTQIVRLF